MLFEYYSESLLGKASRKAPAFICLCHSDAFDMDMFDKGKDDEVNSGNNYLQYPLSQ